MNFRVKTHNAIAESGLTKLSEGNFSVSEEEKDPDAIILRSYKPVSYTHLTLPTTTIV